MSRPTIAVIGASNKRRKFGNKCVRAYSQAGFEVFPVNLHSDEIEGLPAFRTLHELAAAPDRISIYLQPDDTHSLLAELAEYPEAEVWFNPGCASPKTLDQARAAGIDVRDGCSIVDIGMSPGRFP